MRFEADSTANAALSKAFIAREPETVLASPVWIQYHD